VLSLDEIREQITDTDSQLLKLLAKRRYLSRCVAVNKQGNLKPIRDTQREIELLEKLVLKGSDNQLDSHYVMRVFNLIMEDSRTVQQKYLQSELNPKYQQDRPKTIALLGGKGSYSYLAASKHFNTSENTYMGCTDFSKIVESVEQGQVDFGLLPIENTTSGGITEAYDLLLNSEVCVVGEQKYPINHCLVAKPGTELSQITKVLAHPEASKQCRKKLEKLVNVKVVLVSSTADALKQVANSDQGENDSGEIAALASEVSAQQFGLSVVMNEMADAKHNTTRFLVIAQEPLKVSTQVTSKTSIVISTAQDAGSLAEVLQVFKQAQIPLSKLESRPIPEQPWEQRFYIDLEGNLAHQSFQQTLDEVAKLCQTFRLLGCYPTEDINATSISALVHSKSEAKIASSEKNNP
jgi:chorismate mutase/prephenate dehydratase